MQVRLENGFVLIESDEGDDLVKTELSSASDGEWHFVAISRTPSKIRVDIDDLYSNEIDRSANSGKVHSFF